MERSNGLMFTNLEEIDIPTRRVMIEKSDSMTEREVDDFCDWVCQKALLLGFDVRDITNDDREVG